MPATFRQYTVIVLFLLAAAFCIWSYNLVAFIIASAVLSVFYFPQTAQPVIGFIKNQPDKKRNIIEWFIAITLGILLITTLNAYFISLYKVRSTSMKPEYKTGEIVVVDKLRAGAAINVEKLDEFHRLKGFGQFKRYDVIVFHFPEGDTILSNRQKDNYHFLKRQYRDNPFLKKEEFKDAVYVPVKKRIKYIKRIIGLPGETILFRDGTGIVNRDTLPGLPSEVHTYTIKKDTPYGKKQVILNYALNQFSKDGSIIVELSNADIEKNNFSEWLTKKTKPLNLPDPNIFPFDISFLWNKDNFGPVTIPKKGQTVKLTLNNLPLYARIITAYEGNKLELKDETIIINGKPAASYIFKMDYFFVMGDYRPHSFDSRYWGFVPDNHIIGIVDKKLYSIN